MTTYEHDNQRKWENFLSTIRNERDIRVPTRISRNDNCGGIKCLSYDFGNKLLRNFSHPEPVERESEIHKQTRDDKSSRIHPILPTTQSMPNAFQQTHLSTTKETNDPVKMYAQQSSHASPPKIIRQNTTGETRGASTQTGGGLIKQARGSKSDSRPSISTAEHFTTNQNKVQTNANTSTSRQTSESSSLHKWSFSRIVAFILSPLTLMFGGSEHHTSMDKVSTSLNREKPTPSNGGGTTHSTTSTIIRKETQRPETASRIIRQEEQTEYDDPFPISKQGNISNRTTFERNIPSSELGSKLFRTLDHSPNANADTFKRNTAVTTTSEKHFQANPSYKYDEDEYSMSTHITAETKPQSADSLQKTLELGQQRGRRTISPRKRKADIEIPCSSWDMPTFARYFDFDSSVTALEIPDFKGDPSELRVCQERVRHEVSARSDIIFSGSTFASSFFREIRANETTTRLLLDAILMPICSTTGLKMEVEKSIHCSYLIPCKFDYRLLYKGRVIGCIEAKSVQGFSKHSIIQAVLQLMILQAEIFQTKKKEDMLPLFNILTDGTRFVFIQLKDEKLKFEQTNSRKLRINYISGKEDLINCIPKLMSLIEMSTEDKSCFGKQDLA